MYSYNEIVHWNVRIRQLNDTDSEECIGTLVLLVKAFLCLGAADGPFLFHASHLFKLFQAGFLVREMPVNVQYPDIQTAILRSASASASDE